MSNHHGHHHGHSHFIVAGKRELMLWIAFGLTFGFMLVEFVAGILSGSLALVADAIHMLADAGALGLALFAVRLSTRHADDHRTFGYGRMQVLAAFINGLLVLGLSVIIWKEAFKRFWNPAEVNHDMMLWVAVGGLLVNLVIMLMLHTSGSKSVNIKAAMMHVMGDALGSVTVIIAALSIGYFGFNIIDAIASLIVSLFIAYSAKNILAESGHILLEGRPPTLKLDEVSAAIKKAVPEVEGIHHLHAWSLSGEDLLATMHASVNAACSRPNDDILRDIKAVLHKYHIEHSTVQIERAGCADGTAHTHEHH
jgi:cobalt-zinc-cadmium efflux system protein